MRSRRAAALLAGVIALGVASSAHAQEDAAAQGADEDRARGVGVIDDVDSEAARSSSRAGAAADEQAGTRAAAGPGKARWGDGRASRNPRQQPAQGAPYAWRQMMLAAVIMLASLGGVVWIIRRQTRAR